MDDLAALVRKRMSAYSSIRSAARHLGVDHAWLARLARGERTDASDDLLTKLRIVRTVKVTYKELK